LFKNGFQKPKLYKNNSFLSIKFPLLLPKKEVFLQKDKYKNK